jgi:hypothetical protein
MSDSSNNPLNALLSRSAESLRSEWRDLVAVAVRLQKDREAVRNVAAMLAVKGNSSEESICRKLFAIHFMENAGYSEEQIAEYGQTFVLSEFQKSKEKDKQDKLTVLSWKISGAQRQMVQTELDRVKRVLNIQTSESLWDFLLSVLQGVSDEDLLHAAGEKK